MEPQITRFILRAEELKAELKEDRITVRTLQRQMARVNADTPTKKQALNELNLAIRSTQRACLHVWLPAEIEGDPILCDLCGTAEVV